MVDHPLPAWSNDNSNLINKGIEKLVKKATVNASADIFLPLIKDATSLGRKLRSTLTLRCLHWKNLPKKGKEYNNLIDGLSAIEVLHSISCVIDDIIDGDTKRRGLPAFYIRKGLPEAQLIALEGISLGSYLSEKQMSEKIKIAARLMYQGEAVDSFRFTDIKKIITKRKLDLLETYCLKTTPLFSIAHEFIGIAYKLPKKEISQLQKYGKELGTFYQYANDFHDSFSIPTAVRGSTEEKSRITLSMPLILAIKENPKYYTKLIGEEVPRKELEKIYNKMKKDGIEEKSKSLLNSTKENIITIYGKENKELESLLNIIGSASFWSYKYK